MPALAVPYWRLSSFYFFYFALLGAWLPFWPLYLRDLGYSAAVIGALSGVMQGTKIFAPSVWGWLADRSGKRLRIIRFGAAAAAFIFAGIFLHSGAVWLALIVAGYSFFWNAVQAQFEVITLAYLCERVQRYSLVRVWGSVGFIAAVIALGFVFDHTTLRILPWVLLLLLIGILASTLTIAEPTLAPVDTPKIRGSLLAILKQPIVIAFVAINFLLQVSHGPYYTFFSVYLENYHYTRTQTGLLWSLGVVAEIVMFLAMHRLLVKFSVRTMVLFSLALTVLRWLLIAFYVETLPILLFAQCLHAMTFASQHATAIDMVRRLFAGGHEGQGMALYSGVCYGGGAALGAIGSGLLWSISPVATFVVAAAVALLALIIAALWIDPAPQENGSSAIQ